MTVDVGGDYWTYHDFGARSFGDEIRAFIFDDLDQSPDRDAIDLKLGQQAASGALPIIPVPLHSVTLKPQTIHPHGISDVTQLVLNVQLDQESVAVAYLRQRLKLMAKIGNRVAQEIAARIIDSLFGPGAFIGSIPLDTLPLDRIHSLGPDR